MSKCIETDMLRTGAILFAALLAIALLMTACQDDAQSVREANQTLAASTPEATPLTAEIRATELQDGDCVNSTLPEGITIDTVVIVPCSGDWQYRVLMSFHVADTGAYPDEEFFIDQVAQNCGRQTSIYLYPIPGGWELGDRTITCFQKAPDLVISDLLEIMELNPEELSDEEASCLREWVAGAELIAFITAPDDPTVIADFLSCVPGLFDSAASTGTSAITPTPEPTLTPEPTSTPRATPTPEPTAAPTATPTVASDVAPLAALHEAANGANWKNNDNWLSDRPIGEWRGVTTDRNGRVIELDLSENQLTGSIPAELGSLSNLTLLYLWGNSLSGEIPPEIGSLANLEFLDLADNQLTGSTPAELGSLSNLTLLYLWGNSLSGGIPPEIGSLTNLEFLDLADNQLTGSIPAELGSLSYLAQLYVWGNSLSGGIPPELGNLTNLEQLGLSQNQLTGSIPPELGSLSTLVELFISDNSLTGCLPDGWRSVSENDLDDVGLPFCGMTSTVQLSPSEVFDRVSPSVPFIETPVGRGSGVLTEGGYIVTNYHVVWPHDAVRVFFPDGTELQNVPVVGWDPMADLAVLGPVNVLAQPLRLDNGENITPGSELFLVGYPAEVDAFPEPTITRGILSRFREWERHGVTYLQTDAAIAGGQSGGALVNSQGQVVGISTFSFSEAGFGVATSAADNAPIVERLIRAGYTPEIGDRRLPTGSGAFEFSIELANFWDTRAFVLDATAGTTISVELDGPGDGRFVVSAPYGLLLEVDEGETGTESGAVELLTGGPHFLKVDMFNSDVSVFDLKSSIRLKPLPDTDDGRATVVGETVAGSIDFPTDIDWYSIHFDEGQTVRISADSVSVDTTLIVDFPNSYPDQVAADDDSGGGLWSTNAEMVYRAPDRGQYFIVVADALDESTGGYYLSVEEAPAGSETVHVPPAPASPGVVLVESPFGIMRVFEGSRGYFQVEVPAGWVEEDADPSALEVFSARDPEGNGHVVVQRAEGVRASLTEFADTVKSELMAQADSNLTRETFETAQGLPAVLFDASLDDATVVLLVYLSDDGQAINIVYVFPPAKLTQEGSWPTTLSAPSW